VFFLSKFENEANQQNQLNLHVHSMRIILNWLLITSLLVLTRATTDYQLCTQHTLCRDLYAQSWSDARRTTPLEARFAKESKGTNAKMVALLSARNNPGVSLSLSNNTTALTNTPLDILEKLRLYELIIAKALMDENKCPPNTYWYWSDQLHKGECRCHVDRDCRVITTTVCHDTTNPTLFILIAVLIVEVLVLIIARLVTDRYTR
jgi:hypothetical protein